MDGTRLRAISSAAAHAGVRTGMTVAEARAQCAALEAMPWDAYAVAQGITAVTAALIAASPQVTPVAGEPGLWWVGAAGYERLGGERALARTLLAIARRWHPRARVAVADSCVAARAATWDAARGRDAALVPAHGDARYLARVPLALIPMEQELRDTLAALGIRHAGGFAALDAGDVEHRWGSEGLTAWHLARGEDARRPVLAQPAAPRAVEAELPAPTHTMEPVLFLARAALDALATDLAADGRAAAAVAVTLALDDARSTLPTGAAPHTVTREVRLPRPTARAAHLFDHCRALLERWPLDAPACGVTVAIAATAPLTGEQGDLLAPEWRDPAAADAAFARLRAELGAGSVVHPVERDEHAPERSGEWEEPGGRGQDSGFREGDGVGMGVAVLRLLEVAEEVEVEVEHEGTGAVTRPCAVWWRGQRLAVARATGPERLSGEWWRAERYARAYWRCEGEDGAELLVFVEGGRWYVQGWYD